MTHFCRKRVLRCNSRSVYVRGICLTDPHTKYPSAATWRRARVVHAALTDRLRAERGSVAVEYVGLGLVVSMLMASVATAIDSAMGERLARAIVERMIELVG